jgi:hypothetical protein
MSALERDIANMVYDCLRSRNLKVRRVDDQTIKITITTDSGHQKPVMIRVLEAGW